MRPAPSTDVSERSGEAVMKSDRRTRLLGLSGYITHTFFFFRQQRGGARC